MIMTRQEIEEWVDQLARKYGELACKIWRDPRRQENRRRALRIGPGAREAEKRSHWTKNST